MKEGVGAGPGVIRAAPSRPLDPCPTRNPTAEGGWGLGPWPAAAPRARRDGQGVLNLGLRLFSLRRRRGNEPTVNFSLGGGRPEVEGCLFRKIIPNTVQRLSAPVESFFLAARLSFYELYKRSVSLVPKFTVHNRPEVCPRRPSRPTLGVACRGPAPLLGRTPPAPHGGGAAGGRGAPGLGWGGGEGFQDSVLSPSSRVF